MFITHTIHNDDDSIEISSMEDLAYTHIEFKEIKQDGVTVAWDNWEWVKINFPAFLQRYLDRALLPSDLEDFHEIHSILGEEVCKELLEMMEKANKLNFK